jgi:hypothetical protein
VIISQDKTNLSISITGRALNNFMDVAYAGHQLPFTIEAI